MRYKAIRWCGDWHGEQFVGQAHAAYAGARQAVSGEARSSGDNSVFQHFVECMQGQQEVRVTPGSVTCNRFTRVSVLVRTWPKASICIFRGEEIERMLNATGTAYEVLPVLRHGVPIALITPMPVTKILLNETKFIWCGAVRYTRRWY